MQDEGLSAVVETASFENFPDQEPLPAVFATTTIKEEIAADERDFAMHIESHSRVSTAASLLNAVMRPKRPTQLWLDRALETMVLKFDSGDAQTQPVHAKPSAVKCTEFGKVRTGVLTSTALAQ